jgi:hypothetical protein
MKLWKISQNVNNDYDTFDSAVVAAETEDEARNTTPCFEDEEDIEREWASPEDVEVEYLGEAKEGTSAGIICSSFNAG